MTKWIHAKNLPPKLPITAGIAWWLLLDRLQASGWVWGVVGTVYAVAVILNVIKLCRDYPGEVVFK